MSSQKFLMRSMLKSVSIQGQPHQMQTCQYANNEHAFAEQHYESHDQSLLASQVDDLGISQSRLQKLRDQHNEASLSENHE